MNPFTPLDPNNPNLTPSPLADPITGAIFANVESAGLAAESLIRATLKSDGSSNLLGRIIRVTPQFTHVSPFNRGCRVDIDTASSSNEQVIFEVQIKTDPYIMIRDVFTASHIFTASSNKGDTSAQMAKKMPRVVFINILGYNIRSSNKEMVQPFKVLYTKPPQEIAVPNLAGYNIQLPRILEMEPNFDDELYCWCYTLYTAHQNNQTIQEVVSMTPALQAYAEKNNGFQQFCDRYQLVASSQKARDDYAKWVVSIMREEGMMEGARQEGIQKGIQSAMEEVAKKMKNTGDSPEKILEFTGLSLSAIEKL